jgi:hypothetical protein
MLNDCLQVHIKFIHYFRRLFRQLKHQKINPLKGSREEFVF